MILSAAVTRQVLKEWSFLVWPNGHERLNIVSFITEISNWTASQKSESSKENRGECYRQSKFQSGNMNSNSSTVINNSRNIDMMNGEIPISDTLISKIEVQKHLQDQFEVQKKLQRRIEAQGRYLQAILERAQRSLSIDMNSPDNLEATKTRITDFSLTLSNIMDNINGEGNNNGGIIDKRITSDISIIHGSSCLLGREEEAEEEEEDEEEEDIKNEGTSINLT